jgi:hypothetical protein
MTMKVYKGIRGYQEHELGGGAECRGECHVKVDDRPLQIRLDLANHSPTGFEWGYYGSGPAQLSLAILADALGDPDEALHWYQAFKEAVVAHLSREEWSMTEQQVQMHVESLRRRDPERAKRFAEDLPYRLYHRHLKGCETCRKAENGDAPDWCPNGRMLFEAWERSCTKA